jgi:hypothetical protein
VKEVMMNTAMPKYQAGIGFGGFIVGAFLLVALTLFGFKLVPAYMENAKVKNIFEEISHDPEMQKASASQILMSFDRRASVNWVESVKSSDIEISKGEDGRPILTASYDVKVKLGGNVSLLLEFNPTSAGK